MSSVRQLSLMKYLNLKWLIFTAAIIFCPLVSHGQENVGFRKIAEFLKTDWETRTETNEWQFTGMFIAVPEKLQNDLLNGFPKHRFTLAEMRFCGHIPCHQYSLIVITDVQTGDVVGFIRQLDWGIASKSFNHLFDIYQANGQEDLENRLVALGKLIASTDARGSIGRIEGQKNVVSVELLWGGEVWRKLEVKFDSKFRIKRVTLITARK
jgi:hypothetical protein